MHRLSVTVVCALAAVYAITQTACSRAQSEPKLLTPVRTAEVQLISTGTATRYSANIVPNSQVDLAFKSGGYVASIRQVPDVKGRTRNVDTGDWARQGAVLAVVRQQEYQDKLQQAKAQLAKAQADYDNAKLHFDRVSILYSKQSATKPDYDSAKAQYESAVAAVSHANAAISEAQSALEDCSLRAPFDGWIVKRAVDVGALVGPTVAGFTIADTRSVRAVFGVPDLTMKRIRLGQRQVITTDALPEAFAGRVTAISPAADPKSRVYSVEVTVPNPGHQLKAGMIASLLLEGETRPQKVMAIPLSSVIRDPQQPSAFSVLVAEGAGDPTTVRARTVEIGDAYGNMVQVMGGLKSGERVVTSGATLVKSGDQVRVIP